MAMATRAPACAASELVDKGRESAAVLHALLVGQQPAVGAVATPRSLRELTGGGTRKRKPERGYGPAPPPATSSKRTRGERGTRVEKRRTMEDGFIWRKYGQKEIHGSKYPSLYFRCTYKDYHGCAARRQVQRSEADPSVFLITYFGDHTCCRGDDEPLAPFVINFGSSSRDGQPCSSPWPSCDGELQGMDNESEFIDRSTSVPELTSMSCSMEWDPLDGCLDWTLCDGESSFDIDELIGQDFVYFGLL